MIQLLLPLHRLLKRIQDRHILMILYDLAPVSTPSPPGDISRQTRCVYDLYGLAPVAISPSPQEIFQDRNIHELYDPAPVVIILQHLLKIMQDRYIHFCVGSSSCCYFIISWRYFIYEFA